MKTEMALLLMTDGRPVMQLKEVAELLGIGERTAENQIYAERFPMPAFKVGVRWVVNIQDVAAYLDKLREEAQAQFEAR